LALELAPQVARSSVVRDLQSGGWFTRVAERSENTSLGWTRFEMDLQGLYPPAGTARGSAPAVKP
jgi:hypothetical protein